ncbi:MAG: PilZ domain-containing protein [Clostridium sp.]|uniref:PilZ domain-containing protein n=1 Tax=Clostridium sp. TaxID=1506 RepID=UPI0025B8717F|nr:PilZ domain-containing protein [Clostridium sp.]MCH3965415.1 PilZ domain-containing protein [Clostridium sp.]MCI1717353.1 PilZ domain-containing protein [Clostridium sp.]MCI1801693.1 PilZ domain-containing protein [Clostridium sp.]MCI1815556.1 PilZ domain-containing protein [Clostridium sp.]MCI1872459.1 PilZ domain-containing protein [Clostridium sp.]
MKNDSYSHLMNRKQIIKKDKRVNKRIKYDANFKITGVNYTKCNYQVFAVDVSISGIGFLSEVEFKKNDLLELIFKYNSISIPSTVRVTHANLYDRGYFIGGNFIALENTYREMLKQELL